MKTSRKWYLVGLALLISCLVSGSQALAAEELRVVGSWSSLTMFQRIGFLPCRMAMAFACQPLIAGRQKENLSVPAP